MTIELGFTEISRPDDSKLFESVRWNAAAGCFQWVDIERCRLYRWFEESKKTEFADLPFRYLPLAIPLSVDDTLVCSESEVYRFRWSDLELKRVVSIPVPDGVRLNDGNFGHSNDLWVGSMGVDGTGNRGSLYRVGTDGSVSRVLTDVGISNGVVPHPHGGVLHIDTPTGQVTRITEHGGIFRRSHFASVPSPGVPDGMAMSPVGEVWVAVWGGGRIERFDINGSRLTPIQVPRRFPTAVAFGGRHGHVTAITAATGDADGPADSTATLMLASVSPDVSPHSGNQIVHESGASRFRKVGESTWS